MAAATSKELEFGEITFAVPAQAFGITCSISTEQALPIVTEFALRLVAVCDALTPQDLQEFFGFTEREIEQVIQSLVDERLLRWEDDRLELTHYARGLFVNSPDSIPRLTRIKDWAGEVAFELVGFTPVNPTDGAKRARLMVEVPADDPDKESKSKLWAERSFQENFDRIYRGSRAQIYKISDVEGGTRFLLSVPCTFSLTLDGELAVRRSLPEDYLSGRLELSKAITTLLAYPPTPDNSFLADFVRLFPNSGAGQFLQSNGEFDLQAFLLKSSKTHDSGPAVVPVVGSLHLGRNRRLLETRIGALPGTLKNQDPTSLHWVAPTVPFWARSKAMRPLVRDLRRLLERTDQNSGSQEPETEEEAQSSAVKILLQDVEENDRHAIKTYGQTLPEVFGTSLSVLGGRLEFIVVPDQLMCAIYHYQLRHAVSVPFGFVSTEEADIATATQLLKQLTAAPARLTTLTKNAPKAEVVYKGLQS
jgi:hypothetical protein